ncbi:SapC family protein [Sphingomonas sp. OK281]|uniref:SapC family protein n=1 Tax=Sphingomonas sp. OK281 TaxID=1881067 RepID=UPI0008E24682|nr:SapC family protein [Sphingomonas sp. OK281]SFN70321.1 SapC protein [Sphingomonas sp. OK281]
MSSPILLNNVDHHDLRVVVAHGAEWGDAVDQITVFPTEFETLSRDYAIVFRRGGDGKLEARALLGLERGENLFLDGADWTGRSIPALLQRGPFSIGVPADGAPGEPMIHIDPTDPRVATAAEHRDQSERIFLDHGGNAPYLDRVGGILRSIYAGTQIMPALIAAFAEAGLFEEVTLELDYGDERRHRIVDAITLSAERFAALDGAALARLHDGDFLRCAVWLMSSLGNLPALIDRKLARDGRR